MRKIVLPILLGIFLVGMTFGVIGAARGQTPGGQQPALDKPLPNTKETQGENVREVTSSGPLAPDAPTISFIDSPTATCYQPVPGSNDCLISWYSLYVDASPSYMVAMTVTLNTIGTVARVNGFFQTSMYVPNAQFGRGFQVACGAPGSAGAGPRLGNAYGYTIQAVDFRRAEIGQLWNRLLPCQLALIAGRWMRHDGSKVEALPGGGGCPGLPGGGLESHRCRPGGV